MLKPELAKKRLEEFKVKNGNGRRLERAAALPPALREIAYALLGHDAEGKAIGDWQVQSRAREEAKGKIEALSSEEREALFMCLMPGIGKQVEQAWQFYTRLPYQAGYSRKAFRAPNAPDAARQGRHQWLFQVQQLTIGYEPDPFSEEDEREKEAGYEQGVAWFAAWASYLGYGSDALGILFAATIDAGGPEGEAVFEILMASARGEHEIGAIGRHVTRGLLVASRPEGWELIEKLLLAAQRQEGLRQVILETIDEAHPEAFRRMLRVIVDNDLMRFSSALRAVCVWFGFAWDALTPRQWHDLLKQVIQFLEDPAARKQALTSDDSAMRYLALWAIAFEDAYAAIEPARCVAQDPDPEHRLVGARFLTFLGLRESWHALLPLLEDVDWRVAEQAFYGVRFVVEMRAADLFERLERLFARAPKEKRAEIAAALVYQLGDRSPRRLLPYLSLLETYHRSSVVEMLGTMENWDTEVRETIFALIGDPSSDVREKAVQAVAKCKVTEAEIAGIEKLLTRKASDLRRGVLSLLLNQQDDTHVLNSAERLMAAGDANLRLAGLELLRMMTQAQRAPETCRKAAETYRQTRAKRTSAEDELIAAFLDPQREVPTLENGLGLYDPAQRTPPTPPRKIEIIPYPAPLGANLLKAVGKLFGANKREERNEIALVTEASTGLLKSLDELVHQHRETPVVFETWNGSKADYLLGNVQWGFPTPNPKLPVEEDAARLPLRDLWAKWWNERPDELRDKDGLELVRAAADIERTASGKNRYPGVTPVVLDWLMRLHTPEGFVDFCLDAAEAKLASIPQDVVELAPNPAEWRAQVMINASHDIHWLTIARQHRTFSPNAWTDAQHIRLWQLVHWLDQPLPDSPRFRPPIEEVLVAHRAGGATEADLLDQLIGPRNFRQYYGQDFTDLKNLSARKPSPLFETYPILKEWVDRCRKRIIEVELSRGEMPTAASGAALSLRWTGGAETLVRLLAVFGQEPFTRNTSYYSGANQSKTRVFSELIRGTFPAADDTPDKFAALAREAKLSPKRLVELAVYAPQWARHVECALGWEMFAEAVWWLYAHTKDTQWSIDAELREAWAAETNERTPLSAQSLLDGAVDVAWFHRVYAALGPEKWTELDAAAKYASGGGGHKRAQLFADAMLGRVTKDELLSRIREKRNQDALRSLGLLPVAEGKERDRDVLSRYKVLQEFLRTSKQFGSMRQASEKLATQIGMENLARTAGFPDPIRLEWAMEAEAVADLAKGPVTVTAGEVAVSLAINFLGKPEIAITKQGKPLKAVPAALKKDPGIVRLQERKREIERQVSRMRASLETAMCRGDQFTGAELRTLLAHPVLAPMLRSLVFVGEGVAGYPIEGGRRLEAHDGQMFSLADKTRLRIAHPHDLLLTQAWHLWQKDCFLRERIQPFKQVFRELYVLTESETTDGIQSRRYDGHQVNPRQAMALLGGRGWVVHPEEGVRRTFHDHDLTAWLHFFGGYFTPAEVEGLTIESVGFTRRGDWKPLPLQEIPPRVFSEVMRDMDLVVSVAHQGGVDPEASASTVEMRSALLREACGLLKLKNVRLQSSHALIDGELGTYSVHLGSAVVHRQPGGHLCIVPVHSQHRGRLFLPFADDDPKTAEVLSKVLLLAKDTEIKDPSILEQILVAR